MPVFYTKPVLRDLSQGARIAYVRQFRHMTQEELGEKIEMSPGRRRNRICRYERGTRNPKDDRVEKMAEVLEINEAMIKSYDFMDPMDIVYILLWLEDVSPDYILKSSGAESFVNNTSTCIKKALKEWQSVKNKLKKGEISETEYTEWKLTHIWE